MSDNMPLVVSPGLEHFCIDFTHITGFVNCTLHCFRLAISAVEIQDFLPAHFLVECIQNSVCRIGGVGAINAVGRSLQCCRDYLRGLAPDECQ